MSLPPKPVAALLYLDSAVTVDQTANITKASHAAELPGENMRI